MSRLGMVAVVLVAMMGCSNKAVYDNIQRNNQRECNSVPPAQYEECMARSEKPYEEYKRDREAVLGDD